MGDLVIDDEAAVQIIPNQAAQFAAQQRALLQAHLIRVSLHIRNGNPPDPFQAPGLLRLERRNLARRKGQTYRQAERQNVGDNPVPQVNSITVKGTRPWESPLLLGTRPASQLVLLPPLKAQTQGRTLKAPPFPDAVLQIPLVRKVHQASIIDKKDQSGWIYRWLRGIVEL
jgi:hypothetical protein